MSNLFSRIAMRVAYGVSQLPRVAWYVGHSLAVRRLADAARQRDGGAARERAHTNAPVSYAGDWVTRSIRRRGGPAFR